MTTRTECINKQHLQKGICILVNINDIPEKGADSMLQKEVVFYFDKAREIGKEETLQMFHVISSLINESNSEIATALVEQFGITEKEAYKMIDEFKDFCIFQR